MFWAETVPAALFLAMSFFIPESPVFLSLRAAAKARQANGAGTEGRQAAADGGLRTADGGLRAAADGGLGTATVSQCTGRQGTADGGLRTADGRQGTADGRQAAADGGRQGTAGLRELFEGRYMRVLVLGLVIAVFQQWCGTNVIFNYAQEIFVGAGFDVDGMFINIVITGIANVVFTVVALYTIEKWGRRTLILLGAGGLGLTYLTLGSCYYFGVKGFVMVALVVLAISTYAMTLAPVTWTLLAEIFPNRIRGVAMATCTFALWVGCCTLTFSFPSMNAALGSSGSFWVYSVICFCAFVYLWRRCPETKGKSLLQLESELIG